MNKQKKIIAVCFALLAMLATLAVLIFGGVIVLDRSAVMGAENSVSWKGKRYVAISGEYTEGRRLASTDNRLGIYEVKESKDRTFIAARGFLDSWLLVDETYDVPRSGEITYAVWGTKKIHDGEFFEALGKILEEAKPEFSHVSEGIYMKTGGQDMYKLTVAYGDCPVAVSYVGYLGRLNGIWCITVNETDSREEGKAGLTEYLCYPIPDEYIAILNSQRATE